MEVAGIGIVGYAVGIIVGQHRAGEAVSDPFGSRYFQALGKFSGYGVDNIKRCLAITGTVFIAVTGDHGPAAIMQTGNSRCGEAVAGFNRLFILYVTYVELP
ncbi:hypothetical protein D3C77_663670 [compost metagenome]